MQDYRTRVLEAIKKHAQELVAADEKAGTTETAEGKEHIELLNEVENYNNKNIKKPSKFQEQLVELEKTNSLPKDDPAWDAVNSAVKEINKHSPHKPITAPREIVALSPEEMMKLKRTSPAGYIPKLDILVKEKISPLTKEMAAHEIGHKQQQLYDEIPDLSNIVNVESFYKLIYRISKDLNKIKNNEIRADLTSAIAFSEKNYIDQAKIVMATGNKNEIEGLFSKFGAKKIVDVTHSFLRERGLQEADIEKLQKILLSDGINAWKHSIAEAFNKIADPEHPALDFRHFIVQKQLDTGLLNHLAYDEAKVIAAWTAEYEAKQPKKPTVDDILLETRQPPKNLTIDEIIKEARTQHIKIDADYNELADANVQTQATKGLTPSSKSPAK